jgi:hypothetical protein
MTAKGQPDEHLVTLSAEDRERLRDWLDDPSRLLELGRATFAPGLSPGTITLRTTAWKPGSR